MTDEADVEVKANRILAETFSLIEVIDGSPPDADESKECQKVLGSIVGRLSARMLLAEAALERHLDDPAVAEVLALRATRPLPSEDDPWDDARRD